VAAKTVDEMLTEHPVTLPKSPSPIYRFLMTNDLAVFSNWLISQVSAGPDK